MSIAGQGLYLIPEMTDKYSVRKPIIRRILRGVGSRDLACGCLVGVYETYANRTVAIIDAKGSDCHDGAHKVDSDIDVRRVLIGAQPPSTMPSMTR
jgi:hypothetical protein